MSPTPVLFRRVNKRKVWARRIYLVDVKDGGLAHRHAASVGDHLLPINDEPVSAIPLENLMKHLAEAGRPLKLLVKRAAPDVESEGDAGLAKTFSSTPR